MNNSNCKGCKSIPDCLCRLYSNDCPCIKCLVKAACNYMCDDLLNYEAYILENNYRHAIINDNEFIRIHIKNI
jgi:hypothetical protein